MAYLRRLSRLVRVRGPMDEAIFEQRSGFWMSLFEMIMRGSRDEWVEGSRYHLSVCLSTVFVSQPLG
jgi:hypothetical protein